MTDTKPTNPKESCGGEKAGLSAVPQPALGLVALAMTYGARKYGRHNYRDSGVRASTYFDAAWRHLAAWWEGDTIDEDSGLPHLAHAAAGLLVVMDAAHQGLLNDDRPPSSPEGWFDELHRMHRAVVAATPDPAEPYVNGE